MRARPARVQESVEELRGGNVRGWILRAHFLWVLEYGSADDERALVWPQLDGFEPDAWYPFASLIGLDRAIVERFATTGHEASVLEDLGRFSARVNLSMRFAHWSQDDHHRFFEETTRFHRELQDFGRANYARLGPTSGVMTLSQSLCFSRVYCASAAGWYEHCLQLHGAIRPSVVEERCRCFGDEECAFAMRWR